MVVVLDFCQNWNPDEFCGDSWAVKVVGMYNEAEDDEGHKGGRHERHFDAPLFSSAFAGLKYASPGKQKCGVVDYLRISIVKSAPSLLAS